MKYLHYIATCVDPPLLVVYFMKRCPLIIVRRQINYMISNYFFTELGTFDLGFTMIWDLRMSQEKYVYWFYFLLVSTLRR